MCVLRNYNLLTLLLCPGIFSTLGALPPQDAGHPFQSLPPVTQVHPHRGSSSSLNTGSDYAGEFAALPRQDGTWVVPPLPRVPSCEDLTNVEKEGLKVFYLCPVKEKSLVLAPLEAQGLSFDGMEDSSDEETRFAEDTCAQYDDPDRRVGRKGNRISGALVQISKKIKK